MVTTRVDGSLRSIRTALTAELAHPVVDGAEIGCENGAVPVCGNRLFQVIIAGIKPAIDFDAFKPQAGIGRGIQQLLVDHILPQPAAVSGKADASDDNQRQITYRRQLIERRFCSGVVRYLLSRIVPPPANLIRAQPLRCRNMQPAQDK